MTRLWPLLLLAIGCQEPSVPRLEPALAKKYEASCAACHETGAADAPRAHDAEEWARRSRRGDDALLRSVQVGTMAMPPRGLCADCDDATLKALVDYLKSTP